MENSHDFRNKTNGSSVDKNICACNGSCSPILPIRRSERQVQNCWKWKRPNIDFDVICQYVREKGTRGLLCFSNKRNTFAWDLDAPLARYTAYQLSVEWAFPGGRKSTLICLGKGSATPSEETRSPQRDCRDGSSGTLYRSRQSALPTSDLIAAMRVHAGDVWLKASAEELALWATPKHRLLPSAEPHFRGPKVFFFLFFLQDTFYIGFVVCFHPHTPVIKLT